MKTSVTLKIKNKEVSKKSKMSDVLRVRITSHASVRNN